MAVRVEVTKKVFKLEVTFDEDVEEEDVNIVTDATLAFMESRATLEEDVPDGAEVADQLHGTADQRDGKSELGRRVGTRYAHWGDDLTIDAASQRDLQDMLLPFILERMEEAGELLRGALRVILCDNLGIVSTVSIQRVFSLFKLCWDLFKLALISYGIAQAFKVLGIILTKAVQFLQQSRFFQRIRETGGWATLSQLISIYNPSPQVKELVKYTTIAAGFFVIGALVGYLYYRK